MNMKRREQIARLVRVIAEAKTELEGIRDEEIYTSHGNMPENLQRSERARQSIDAFAALDDAVISLDEIVGSLQTAAGLPIRY